MNTNRRDFIKIFTSGVSVISMSAFFSGLSCMTSWKQRPNILWLDAEDLCPDLNCYGNLIVKTPNLNKLASEGIRYENAFTTSPVCSPSRSAIFTGMYQTTIGAHHHRSHREDGYELPDGVKLVTEYFREAGYFCCRCEAEEPDTPGKLDFNFKMTFDEAFDGTSWNQCEDGQPFFAHVHFKETHRTFESDPDNPIDPHYVHIPPYYPDHPITRKDWALYLETVQVLDKKIGKILNKLEETGLSENTIVFFTGDHGRPMLRGKQWLYDSGIHIPLIIRWKGKIKPGQVSDKLVSSIDFAPTWLKMAGINPPANMQGRNILDDKTEREYIFSARDRCDETDDRIRCVRSRYYKYIRNFDPELPYMQFNAYKKYQYPVWTLMNYLNKKGMLNSVQESWMAPSRPLEELYDLENDPYEIHNLANKPEYKGVLEEYRNKLDKWIKETGDQGEVPEDESIKRYWDEVAVQKFRQRMESRGLKPDISDEEHLKWWQDFMGV